MKYFAVLLFLGLSALAPTRSDAADAYVIGAVSLRAGPDIGYPQILILPAGIPVSVYGCTDGWEWCDVQADNNRGWVSGQFLQYEYQNQRVLLPDYGARVGIPIVAFVLGAYWDQNYRSRSWYRQRDSWSHRTFAHRPPPRPAMQSSRAGNRQMPAAPRPPFNRSQPSRTTAVARPSNNRPRSPAKAAPRPQTQVSRPAATPRPTPANRPAAGNTTHPSAPANRAAQRPAPRAKPAPKSAPKPKKDPNAKDGGHP